jgi:phosphoribosylaminoimidazole-succinocarboxamide synthase
MSTPVIETTFSGVPAPRRGKVRDVYAIGTDLLIVATDRISAFDYVLASGIPDKGKVLNQLSAFWFEMMASLVPHHVLTTDVAAYPASLQPHADVLRGRSMLVRRTAPLAIECVVRGYLSGSGWKEYKQTQSVCGIALPAGLRESDRLPSPIFTPSTKAESGHDQNITQTEAAAIVGERVANQVRDLSIEIYQRGAAHALTKGIILADTKFEFGLVPGPDGREQVMLIDEVLTPDSSRFWPADEYKPGGSQPSYDKQFVRDYLEETRWNKQPPAPALPDEVVARTRDKYLEAHRVITGKDIY